MFADTQVICLCVCRVLEFHPPTPAAGTFVTHLALTYNFHKTVLCHHDWENRFSLTVNQILLSPVLLPVPSALMIGQTPCIYQSQKGLPTTVALNLMKSL